MYPNKSENRKTSIIEDAVGLEQSLAQQGKRKGKGQNKQKIPGRFSFSTSRNAGISKQKSAPKAKAAPPSGERLCKADGLKIPRSQTESSTNIVTLPKQGEHRAINATPDRMGQVVHRLNDIPTSHEEYNKSRARHASAPHLKNGKHGPGGDFDSDPARATGEGHEHDPEDLRRFEIYLQFRSLFYTMHPTYPRLRGGEQVDPRFRAAWDAEQIWYSGFAEKYPGRRLDQWPCGCQKLCEEDESEDGNG